MLTPATIALPQLAADGLIADAAFVDGSHRFHEVFVDLYSFARSSGPAARSSSMTTGRRRCGPRRVTTSRTWAGSRFLTLSPAGRRGSSAPAPQPKPCPVAGHSGCPTRRSSLPSRSSALPDRLRSVTTQDRRKRVFGFDPRLSRGAQPGAGASPPPGAGASPPPGARRPPPGSPISRYPGIPGYSGQGG